MSNLTQRILVALIGIPIVIYVSFKPFSLLGLVLIFALIAVHEFYGLAKVKGFVPQVGIGMTVTAFIVLSFAHFRLPTVSLTSDLLPLVLILGVIATMTAELWKGYPNPLVQISVTLAGAVYVGIGLGGFYGVHEYFFIHAAMAQTAQSVPDLVQTAAYFTIAMLASIWICDSAAFTVGRKMGKHKIAEKVSPNKSWEGGIAGLIAAILVWFAVRAFVPPLYNISVVTCIAMGLIVGVFGQIGDFAESLIKRDAGVKDSSTLIPGHGGVLDRLDSILFVAPLTYLYLHLFGV
ncbi:MAG TPA: phosphatidate cytidylyltransferase [Candidatus Kapabacteria bacterium]|jgi:phosphatidate cytidylyltransferase|nr:phosphatidate cytidylyltransferase [Candidatus Kapabacteria bacterium]